MSNETTTQTESSTMNKSKKVDPNAAIMAELAKLKAENEALKAKQAQRSQGTMTCKVSEKGAVSVYGLGRFPVTLYKEQWIKLLKGAPEDHFILAFIRAHDGELSLKADKVAAAAAQG